MPVLSLHYRPPENGAFDFTYYASDHLELVNRVWGPLLTQVQVLKGIASLDPDAEIGFTVITLLHFASDADLQAALNHPDAALLQADISRFSSVAPSLQLNSVLHG